MDMIDNFIIQLQDLFAALKINMHMAVLILGLLWLIQIFNFCVNYRLNYLGIVPRNLFGLVGLFFAPFLHGSFSHLFFNSIPLFALSCFLLILGLHKYLIITGFIMVIS